MAYEEYFDLYLLAQRNENAPYYMVSFDVVNSKQLSSIEYGKMYENIGIIIKYVYFKLLEYEKQTGSQVLIKDERFFRPWEPESKGVINYNYMDPYLLHLNDSFQFTVLRGSVSKEQIIKWVYEQKNMLNMKEEFHISDGYYETNDYGDGRVKFYRGYCISTLENLHKPEVQKDLKRIRKKLKIEE